MKATFLAIAIVTLFLHSPARAAEKLELVQSVPVETTLEVPGIRHAQQVWLEMIGTAKVSIDLEQMYVSDQPGEALVPVLKALEVAGNRGVRVRLLADRKFYKTYPQSIDYLDKTPNSEARTADFSQTGGIQHAKYFIVDGRITFVGSQNFDWRALTHIHEIGVRIDDRAVASQVKRIFETDWAAGAAVGNSLQTTISTPDESEMPKSDILVVASPKALNPAGIADSLKAIVDLIDSARDSVRIQVMDYGVKAAKESAAPWLELDSTIRRAAQRGAQVELTIDIGHYKNAKKELDALAATKNVQVKTVKIPLWSGGEIPYARLIHSKYVVADGARSWIGSENWTHGYFTNTRNVGIITNDSGIAEKLDQVFERVWNSSYATLLK